MANNNADLWDGQLQHPINLNNLDQIWPGAVWTGSNSTGQGGGPPTLPLQLGSVSGGAILGSSVGVLADWIFSFDDNKNSSAFLYAMSSVLTVPGNQPEPVTVPEPTSLLGYITLGGLMLGGAVRKARK